MTKDQQTQDSPPSLTKEDLNRLLGGWEGYRLGTIGRQRTEEGQEELWIELLPVEGRIKVCSGCQGTVDGVHDWQQRWVRDLPLLGTPVSLLVHRCRVACPRCGPKLEALSWLGRYRRVTQRLAQSVARLCQVLPIKHVAEYFGLHWHTVKSIDHLYLEQTLGPVDLSGIEVIALDDFALRKGYHYATVIVDPLRKQVLWVGAGRGREDIRPFFELLGPAGRTRLKAVVMDMWGAYEQEVCAQCPHVEVIYDLFHIVARYGREVIDRVRLDEGIRVQSKQPRRQVIKGARWLLLRNPENVPRADRVRLRELLQANRR